MSKKRLVNKILKNNCDFARVAISNNGCANISSKNNDKIILKDVGINNETCFKNEINSKVLKGASADTHCHKKEKKHLIESKFVNKKISENLGEINNKYNLDINFNKFTLYKIKHKNKRIDLMIICALLGLIICLLILSCCTQTPPEVVGIISTITGIFGACLKDVYSFEFGSSRGSKEKDEQIIDLLNK